MLLSGYFPAAMQQQDGLRAELATDAPRADPDGKGIYRHEGS
jgi:hypothetical protein